ncbi:MAG: hypothetical protein D8M57_00910 [Candidatus Scalindua sp. AMX11]|nr:MAG: hypothetical protein DWQ00_14890 [Candidatus Scalindua sp.]NOG84953.1 hypothetical protein [Planctomycetota bacterium]RZV93010.1 MAG: hypothetical protein EX341_03850 [Candidatus Scalindua sp. SCAELEC01]TDE66630.1 MAG: hypothetical protein D8M57_00910 [Candidatus Scalindua sp. AMX11]GJQ57936.1 MAG: NAD(P)/FAD-dependent oxidoreductase [Candidatus Scalindua sp.]
METTAIPDPELRQETIERKKQPGYRCLGKQRDGNYSLCIGIPTACFSGAQLRELSEIIEKFATVGHFSTAQSLIIVGIPEQKYHDARRAVLDAGFEIRSVGRDVRQVKSCTGADFSPFGLQRTIPLATELEKMFRGLPTPMKFKVSVSGCPNCCANTKLNDFGIHGTVDGWKVFIGGKMGATPVTAEELASGVQPDEVPKYLAAVLRVYRKEAQPNERLAKTLSRIGFDTFRTDILSILDTPFDDLTRIAQDACEKAAASHCIDL